MRRSCASFANALISETVSASIFALFSFASESRSARLVERAHDFAARVHALVRLDRERERRHRQRLVVDDPAAESARHVGARDLQHLPIALGRDEADLRAGAGQHGVGRDGRAVHHVLDRFGVMPARLADAVEARQHADRLVLRRARHLGAPGAAALLVDQQQVGEGAADVDAESVAHVVSFAAGKSPALVKHSRHAAAEALLEPARGLDRAARDRRRSRRPARKHVEQILGRYVTRRRGRERTAADAADAGIERVDAGLDRRPGVGDAGVARVVEMAAQRMPGSSSRQPPEQLRHLARHAGADRVRDRDLDGFAFGERLRECDHARGRHLALERAAEGGRDRDLRADAGGARGARDLEPGGDRFRGVAPWLRWLKVSLATTTMPISSQPAASARSKPRRFSTRPM